MMNLADFYMLKWRLVGWSELSKEERMGVAGYLACVFILFVLKVAVIALVISSIVKLVML